MYVPERRLPSAGRDGVDPAWIVPKASSSDRVGVDVVSREIDLRSSRQSDQAMFT